MAISRNGLIANHCPVTCTAMVIGRFAESYIVFGPVPLCFLVLRVTLSLMANLAVNLGVNLGISKSQL